MLSTLQRTASLLALPLQWQWDAGILHMHVDSFYGDQLGQARCVMHSNQNQAGARGELTDKCK